MYNVAEAYIKGGPLELEDYLNENLETLFRYPLATAVIKLVIDAYEFSLIKSCYDLMMDAIFNHQDHVPPELVGSVTALVVKCREEDEDAKAYPVIRIHKTV